MDRNNRKEYLGRWYTMLEGTEIAIDVVDINDVNLTEGVVFDDAGLERQAKDFDIMIYRKDTSELYKINVEQFAGSSVLHEVPSAKSIESQSFDQEQKTIQVWQGTDMMQPEMNVVERVNETYENPESKMIHSAIAVAKSNGSSYHLSANLDIVIPFNLSSILIVGKTMNLEKQFIAEEIIKELDINKIAKDQIVSAIVNHVLSFD